MRKRAALARALALEPDLLFLDEPTSGLDPVGAREFYRLLRALADSLGLTVFFLTHDLDMLVSIADRVIALAAGRVIADGTVSAVRGSERSLAAGVLREPRLTMEPEAKYTLVGAAALILVALLAAAVVWLRQQRGGRERPAATRSTSSGTRSRGSSRAATSRCRA